jgi:hypothetical protein
MGDNPFVLQRKVQSGKVWLSVGGISPIETIVALVSRVLRETGLAFSSDELVRDEVVLITLSDGTKQRVSVFPSLLR